MIENEILLTELRKIIPQVFKYRELKTDSHLRMMENSTLDFAPTNTWKNFENVIVSTVLSDEEISGVVENLEEDDKLLVINNLKNFHNAKAAVEIGNKFRNEHYKICSCCESPLNLSNWMSFGGKFEGFCVGVITTNSLLGKVEVEKIDYANPQILKNKTEYRPGKSDELWLTEFNYTLSNNISYQNEVRLGHYHIDKTTEVKVIPVDPNDFCSLFIGYRTKLALKKKLYDTYRRKNEAGSVQIVYPSGKCLEMKTIRKSQDLE